MHKVLNKSDVEKELAFTHIAAKFQSIKDKKKNLKHDESKSRATTK